MPLIDLSHPIVTGMPVYPGTENIGIEQSSDIPSHGFREKRFCLNSHTGTHMDAPAHMIADGKTLDQLPIDQFMGSACVYRHPAATADVITVEHLRPWHELLRKVEFLLICTGWDRNWGTPEYFTGFPVLSAQAAKWLCEFNLKGVGLDTLSADRLDSRDFEVHMHLLHHNVVIIENLRNLQRVPDQPVLFSCLPIPLADADGAPVRAVVVVDME